MSPLGLTLKICDALKINQIEKNGVLRAGEIPVVMISAAAFLNIVCKVNCIRQPDCSAFNDSTILIGNLMIFNFWMT